MATVDPNAVTMPPPVDSAGLTLPPESATGVDPGGPPPVPGYEIVRELGRGGMGVVYLARQTKLNRHVALKMVLAGGHASPQTRVRFLAEAEAVAAVQHPHVVQVYDFGTHDDRPYFALEYCAGGSLKDKLAGTPLTAKEAAELVAKIAVGVQAAHAAGHIHRDLKPDNVLFAADGTPKVTDFGLARRFDTDSNLTNTGAILGTPSYMAPEQAAAKKDIGPACDVYALGAILYECLTGRPPFRAATALDTVLQVVNEEPVAPRALVPTLPRDIETICLKCLNKEPGKRYPSAQDTAADLMRFAAGDAIAARPVSEVEKTWKWVRRRPILAALILAVVVLVGGIIGLVTGTNRALRSKQDVIEQESAATRAALADAEVQREKAQARLKKAVEAVEKVTTRLNGRQWSRNPVLAAERRVMLDDVSAFYQSFDDADANDPLIRRETAKALRSVGGVAVLLGDYEKAAAAFGRARDILAKLADEYPADADCRVELSHALMMVGHTAASRGRLTDAGEPYRQAVAVARQAIGSDPASLPARRAVVDCLASLGYFALYNDPVESAKLFAEASAESDQLVAADPSFATRTLAAYCRLNLANAAFVRADSATGMKNVVMAEKLVAEAGPPDPTAPARYHDLADQTGAMLKLFAANRHAQQKNWPAALQSAAAALADYDALLAVYPKMLPYRLFKMRALMSLAQYHANANQPVEKDRRLDEVLAMEEAILADAPEQQVVRVWAVGIRASRLAWRVKTGDYTDLDAAADRVVAAASAADAPVARYDLACALALGTRDGPPDVRKRRADRAMAELTGLFATSFFTVPARYQYMLADTDLDPIRRHADYPAFAERAKAMSEKK